jgi:hypothetical protein
VSVRVIDRDLGLEAFRKSLKELSNSGVTVGIHEDAGGEAHDELSIAEVAAFHEFGLGVPERSMVRAFVDENAEQVKEWQREAGQAVVEGQLGPEQALERLGEQILGAMKERILAGIAPELSEATKRHRGDGAVALVDTTQMLGAFAYKLVNP